MALRTDGHWFRDEEGRAVLLRGVNLAGSSKLPAGCGPIEAADPTGADAVSFVGRPFPIAEADEHLDRLRHWGFNALRLLTTWEAIEHSGPGVYDETYLDYLAEIVERAGRFGLYVFIDPHQDAWSRFSGGDGAPAWTLELAGFDLEALDPSEAAITMRARYPDDYATMIWPNNWSRLACATMFSLFFAGEVLAPDLLVEGENIQAYLQRHFIGSLRQVARRLRGFPHVLGYDSLNEPSAGYIGLASLRRRLPVYADAPAVTGLQSLAIPSGLPTEVPRLERRDLVHVEAGTVVLNPRGISAWRDPDRDVWRRRGVWDLGPDGSPRALLDDYFAGLRFVEDGLRPFARRYAEALRAEHPEALLFIEGEPGAAEPLRWDGEVPVVHAGHWYDLLTLTTKHYDPSACLEWGSYRAIRGEEAVRESFERQIGAIVEESRRHLGGAPTLIGEFGLPIDLDDGASFRSGDFGPQTRAFSAYYDAIDAHLAHATLWNYTPDNTNALGDGWNQEDLSIFGLDERTDPDDPDSGGRGVPGFRRPTVRACAGVPTRQSFEFQTGAYRLEIEADGRDDAATTIYVPRSRYPGGPDWSATGGRVEHDPMTQGLTWRGVEAGPQVLTLRPRS